LISIGTAGKAKKYSVKVQKYIRIHPYDTSWVGRRGMLGV
jgi:hypothetical protein